MRELAPTAVYAPFRLGNPDHDCTHDAAMLVRDRFVGDGSNVSWFLYEDIGYQHIPGLLAWRVASLFRRGAWPPPAAVPVSTDRARKDAAVACHPSQLRALEAEWAISTKLDAPAPEQFWRLAPPPPGWEGLIEAT